MAKVLNKLIAILIATVMILFLIVPIVKSVTSSKEIVLVIDPGHGGKMTGAVNNAKGLIERDLNLKIARYLRDYLNEYDGIKVIMTHDGLPSDVELELPERGMVARNNNADMMISLHLNDSTDRSRYGAEVYVTNNKLLPKYHEESAKFGNIVLNKLSALGLHNNGVLTRLCNEQGPKWEYSDGSIADYYAVIRYPMKGDGEDRGADLAKGEGIPGVLIEHCYMINDSNFIDSEEDLQKLARADCDAIVEYYGLFKKDPSRVSSISIDKSDVTLLKGEKTRINATVSPTTALNKNITWTSNNENIATVSNTGEITAVGVGTTTITVKTEDREKTVTVTVKVDELKISFNKEELNLIKGNKIKLDYTILPERMNNKEVKFQSSDINIASVDDNGIVTAIAKGEATITATITEYGLKTTLKVNVNELEENQKLYIKNLKQENCKLSNIPEKTTAVDFKKNFEISSDLEVILKNSKGELLKETDYVGTNAKVEIIDKNTKKVLQEYTCLMYADVNCDGKISALDFTLIENHIMDIQKIIDANQIIVADVNGDNKISAIDFTLIENHIMDIQKIPLK